LRCPEFLHRRAGAILVVPALLIAGGVGGSTPSTSSSASGETADAAAAAQVPAAITAKGTLTIAADATYAPDEFIGTDGTTVVGMDADLAVTLGKVLGLKVQVVNVKFDNIIPGLSSAKYDLGMSSFTDTKDREKTVDFVTYFTAGTSFFIKKGGPNIQSLNDLCGHHVSVESGTTEQMDAQTQSTACTGAGKAAVDVQVYPDQNSANAALSSGRADVGMADSPVAAYQVQQSNGTFAVSGPSYGNAPYGIAIPKGNGFAAPLLQAVKDIMADGTYTTILKKWGIQDGAITNPTINGATS
jgi:polar amino acid transport system substrate-binding protein